ncbi:MAG: DUF2478 domain-containing protein [Pikeienuella sp.]
MAASPEPVQRRIAVLEGADGDGAQALLAAVAARWRAAGARVVGLIAETHELPGRTCAAGFLRDIASGARHPIYLETPPADTSCHLDGDGMATACAALMTQIADGDLVLLSKFGKLEAAKAGLFPAFEAALAAGKPVLTTVSDKHRGAWAGFAPDVVAVPANERALGDWWGRLHQVR